MSKKILGFYFFVIGLIILLKLIFQDKIDLFLVSLISANLFSIPLIIVSFVNKKHFLRYFFPGTLTFMTTLFLMILEIFLKGTDLQIVKLWPSLTLISGITLILSYFFSVKKNQAILIPGVFISLISTILLFFAISGWGSFRQFLFFLVPSVLMYLGLYLLMCNKNEEKKDK